jgi:murein DD-endopeptidase MepM/ murein hydrolase activator NlpD
MTQVLSATSGLFRDRDLFIHDGSRLRRFRISAPVQAVFFLIFLGLVAWSGFATAQLVTGGQYAIAAPTSLSAATEARARQIEQRQALIEAMLSGQKVDPKLVAAAAQSGSVAANGPLARVEQAQFEQAAMVAKALDVRYQVTAAELKRLGLTPARVGSSDGVGGPFESAGNPTFRALFNSWKKLDTLQDGVIAIPADKPVRTATFMSGFGYRSDPFNHHAAMHPGLDLAGPVGTPIYATADGVVLRAGWNSGGYGNLVEIDHGRGITTRYGHMSAILVRPGDHITRGQQVGRMGSTGRSTGSHLHYEVRIDGRAVNPMPFMKSTDYVLAMQRRSGAAPMESLAIGGPTGGK